MNWIDVNKELPNCGEAVSTIGVREDGGWTTPITAQLWIDEKGQHRFISGFSFGGDRLIKTMVETKPTHWMPLPSPPSND